jgi:hypothetical protein
MPRLPGVPTREAGLLGRLAYRIARYRYVAVPEPVAVMLHHRPVFWAYALWELGNEKAMRRLPASLRELVVYRWPPRWGVRGAWISAPCCFGTTV